MAKYTVTRKSIVNALADQNVLAAIVDVLGVDPEEVKPTIRAMVDAANAKRESKPTAETLRNERIMHELVEEVNARGVELTAADLADVYADEDGMPISSRKVGAIMRHAIQQGLVAISPEKWVIKHYAPLGFTNWAKKPEKPAAPEVTELAA